MGQWHAISRQLEPQTVHITHLFHRKRYVRLTLLNFCLVPNTLIELGLLFSCERLLLRVETLSIILSILNVGLGLRSLTSHDRLLMLRLNYILKVY